MKSSGWIPTGRIKIKLELNLNVYSWRIKSKGLEVRRSDLTMKAKSEIVRDASQMPAIWLKGTPVYSGNYNEGDAGVG